jgi:hypothetical protein
MPELAFVMYPVRQTYKAQLSPAFTSLLVHVFPYCTDFVLLSKLFSFLLQAFDRISRSFPTNSSCLAYVRYNVHLFGLVFFIFSSR